MCASARVHTAVRVYLCMCSHMCLRVYVCISTRACVRVCAFEREGKSDREKEIKTKTHSDWGKTEKQKNYTYKPSAFLNCRVAGRPVIGDFSSCQNESSFGFIFTRNWKCRSLTEFEFKYRTNELTNKNISSKLDCQHQGKKNQKRKGLKRNAL